MLSLFKPYMPQELPELNAILHSGKLAYGKWGKLFEKELGRYIGEEKIVTVNSYNAAMQLVLTLINIKQGDEIIASPMSCLASNQPFVTQGAKVIWADIDPETGTLDPNNVRDRITPKTRAIFHNHHCGYVGYIDEINSIGHEYGLYVIDDAIEAFGSEYKNKKIGNVESDITVYSFQTVRLPNTIDGGALALRNDDLYKKALLIRDLGVNRTTFRDNNDEINKYSDVTLPGFGITLSEVNSYIGFLQLQKIKELLSIQRQNASYLESFIMDYPECSLLQITEGKPNYWVFGLLSNQKSLSMNNFRKMGLFASGVHLPNNFYSVFNNKELLPGVTDFYSKFLALPCGWWIEKYNF